MTPKISGLGVQEKMTCLHFGALDLDWENQDWQVIA